MKLNDKVKFNMIEHDDWVSAFQSLYQLIWPLMLFLVLPFVLLVVGVKMVVYFC